MELIESKKEGHYHQCNVCNLLYKKVIEFNKDDFYGNNKKCSDCLLKAYLLINPIKLKSMDASDILGYLKALAYYNKSMNAEDKHIKDISVFIDWVSPFLESK